MIIKKNTGSGAITILDKHIFADSTARDAYFVLHPTELIDGLMIQVGTDFEKYQSSATTFNTITAVVKGDAATIQAGTVTMLASGSPATVTNSGTTSSAIFNFGLPNTDISSKQDTLVSGTNIKTINGTSVLGAGNIVISGGGGGGAVDSVNTKTGVVTLNQDEIPDGTTYKQYSQTEKTKLSGIATGAQVNTSKVKASATDATEGYLGDKLVAGTNVTITKNNSGANETYTIASSGGGGTGVVVYSTIALLKAVNTSAYTGGEIAYVTNIGSFEFLLDINVISDDDMILRPSNGIGKWLLKTQLAKEIDWKTVGLNPGTVYNSGTIFVDDSSNGSMYVSVSPSALVHNNIITNDSMKGRNKVIYTEFSIEGSYDGTNQNIFLRANKHAADGADYSSVKVSTAVGGNVYPLTVYTCAGSTPTETSIVADSAAIANKDIIDNSNYDKTDSIIMRAVCYEGRIQVDLFTRKRKARLRTVFIDSPTFAAMTGDGNGFNMFGNAGANGNFYQKVLSKTINAGSEYKNIVCLGDSQTIAEYIPGYHNWVNQMAYLKRKEPVSIYNAGVSSDTIALAKARIATDVTPKFLTGVDNICVINLGTNDLDQGANDTTVIARLTDLIATIKGLGWKVAVMTLANLFTPYITDETLVNGYIATINTWILANTDIDFKIDLNERLRDSTTGLSNRQYVRVHDGVHFTSPAQRIIATTVLKGLGLD